MTFGEKIKKLRTENNLTQEQLAEKLYVTRTAVSKWETDRGLPAIDTLKEIAELFNVSLDSLISDDDVKSKKLADEKRARIFYIVAIAFLALTVGFTLTAYFTSNKYFAIGSCLATAAYVVFALLSRPKYKRMAAKKVILPYIISRLVILAAVTGAIIYALVTL